MQNIFMKLVVMEEFITNIWLTQTGNSEASAYMNWSPPPPQQPHQTLLQLTFKHLWSHPGCTALIVGHVGLNITSSSKVTYLQHSTTSHKEQTATAQQTRVLENIWPDSM